MFTELRSKLSPPRARAGAVRTGFGERPDVDGELGCTQKQEYRGRLGGSGRGTGPRKSTGAGLRGFTGAATTGKSLSSITGAEGRRSVSGLGLGWG